MFLFLIIEYLPRSVPAYNVSAVPNGHYTDDGIQFEKQGSSVDSTLDDYLRFTANIPIKLEYHLHFQ